jgi:hypothetical protein
MGRYTFTRKYVSDDFTCSCCLLSTASRTSTVALEEIMLMFEKIGVLDSCRSAEMLGNLLIHLIAHPLRYMA